MSLFDTIICEYPLPLPEFSEEELEDMSEGEGGEGKEINWVEFEWQTKDLGNMLDSYTIEEDGQIYGRKTDWVDDEDSPTGVSIKDGNELEKYEKTAEINFYNIILGKEYDHWIEFKAIIWKGDLKELDLVEYKKEDNEDRREYVKRIHEQMDELSDREKKWGFLYKVYRLCLVGPIQILRYIAGVILQIISRIERWMP
jgi:hypothetical protein